MAEADPTWLAPALAIGSAFGAMIAAVWHGRRPKGDVEGGEQKVVASSLFASQPIRDLITAVQHLEVQIRRLADQHEAEERDAMAELKAEMRRLGKKPGEGRYEP